MKPDVEIAILGAGCAGLSLAVALGVARLPLSVMLLEPRSSYGRDRTWCFWDTEEHPFTAAISRRWSSWRVSSGAREVVQQSRRHRYCHIAADRFYDLAIGRIEREQHQRLCLGTTVQSVAPDGRGLVAIETSKGRLLARQVFDGRPPARNANPPALLQRFVGWHVRTATACFQPERVDLMRFLPSPERGRTRFLYILPYAADEALVEMTYLDDPALPAPACEQDLEEWLGSQTTGWEILYTEHGSLPMQPVRPASGELEQVCAIGIRGGRIKASSGYAFLRIQSHSRAIAAALSQGAPVPDGRGWGVYPQMDAIFLRAATQAPESVPDLFLRMFERNRPDALVRFLGETSRPAEMLRVAWSLPKRPLLRAAASVASQALLRAAQGGGAGAHAEATR